MVITDTAETNKFINIISAAPSDFSEGFGECAETLMNENNMDMSHDALSAFWLVLISFEQNLGIQLDYVKRIEC